MPSSKPENIEALSESPSHEVIFCSVSLEQEQKGQEEAGGQHGGQHVGTAGVRHLGTLQSEL